MTTKVLLASDGSNHALRAAEEAIKLSKLHGSEIVIAYVSGDDNRNNSTQLQADVEKKLQETESMIKEAALSHTVQVLYGEPAEAIADFANNQPFEFLVIGSRGLNKMQEMVMGSVSYQVMKLADCPVLVVK